MRLIEPALRKIVKSVKYALSVQSVLLGGNPGISLDLRKYIVSHLQAQDDTDLTPLKLLPKPNKYAEL